MTPALIRKTARSAAVAVLLALAAAATAAPVADGPGTPVRAYLDLRAAAAQAKAADGVMARLSSNYRRVVSNLPRAEREGWFQRFRRFPPSPVHVQAQAIAGDRCTLGAVARDASRVKWSGRIELLREGGAWKLADETWTSENR
ncbi:hypothetical protein BURK1_00471 [Burkholderiales bacterium]|nr:hypothetical protein BURK1_00471 [Burkholderiales bacterium]